MVSMFNNAFDAWCLQIRVPEPRGCLPTSKYCVDSSLALRFNLSVHALKNSNKINNRWKKGSLDSKSAQERFASSTVEIWLKLQAGGMATTELTKLYAASSLVFSTSTGDLQPSQQQHPHLCSGIEVHDLHFICNDLRLAFERMIRELLVCFFLEQGSSLDFLLL